MDAVILAGGLGSRLKPFTQAIPKALLPIGEKAILELQIERFKLFGFSTVYVATNYKSDYIEKFVGTGIIPGIDIIISKEDQRLGTVGPLSLLRDKLLNPFILMNGDILTSLDFTSFCTFSDQLNSALCVATKEVETPFSFGKITHNGVYITSIEEKPNFKIEVLAGIYRMTPEIFKFIPDNTYFGMDDLLSVLFKNNVPVGRYCMQEYWLDIGRISDYELAQIEYANLG